jgi:DNA polymerase beta
VFEYVGKYETKMPRKITTEIYDIILKNNKNKDIIFLLCGSYRRGLPQSSDIDLLICDLNLLFKEDLENSNTLKIIIDKLKKINLITDDITSSDVLTKYMGFCRYKDKNYRIDIRLMPYESIYSALLYFTGSYQLNTLMRVNAKKLNYKLNEYGLYKNNKMIDIYNERDIFDLLKMEYLEPEQRNIF